MREPSSNDKASNSYFRDLQNKKYVYLMQNQFDTLNEKKLVLPAAERAAFVNIGERIEGIHSRSSARQVVPGRAFPIRVPNNGQKPKKEPSQVRTLKIKSNSVERWRKPAENVRSYSTRLSEDAGIHISFNKSADKKEKLHQSPKRPRFSSLQAKKADHKDALTSSPYDRYLTTIDIVDEAEG